MSQLTVYDCASARERLPLEYKAFKESADAVGPAISIVEVHSVDDFPDGEARRIFIEESFDALPVTEFKGAAVTEGSYPTDQEIVDYVDVPEGVLGAKRTVLRAANDFESPCYACFRTR